MSIRIAMLLLGIAWNLGAAPAAHACEGAGAACAQEDPARHEPWLPPAQPALPELAPRAWDRLTAQQRSLLAPFQARWNSLPPLRQANLLRRAQFWSQLPAARQLQIRQRIEQWQHLSPAERQRIRANFQFFHQLSPIQRERLHAAFDRFQQLPLSQRQALLQRWQYMNPEQRRAMIEAPDEHLAIPPPRPDPGHEFDHGRRALAPQAGDERRPPPALMQPVGPPPAGFGPAPSDN